MAKKVDSKKSKSNNNDKPTSKSKKFRLIIPVIIIICIIIFVLLILIPSVVEAEAKAQLIIESGTVQVKQAGGSWTTAEDGMELFESDSVKTGDNTSASIILFKSSIIRLDSNTEVTLREIIQQEGETSIKIEQDLGRTWNTVRNISGIDNYEVQTPTAIASVRGTSFGVFIIPNDENTQADYETVVGVSNGIVYVSSIKNGQVIDTIEVKIDEAVIIDPDLIGLPLKIIPFEKDNWVLENQQKDEEYTSDNRLLEEIKEDLYTRINPYIPQLKEEYGITDQELEILIDGYVLGYFDLPDDTPNWIRELFEIS